jgi:hypothetical protein
LEIICQNRKYLGIKGIPTPIPRRDLAAERISAATTRRRR